MAYSGNQFENGIYIFGSKQDKDVKGASVREFIYAHIKNSRKGERYKKKYRNNS